MREGEKKNNHKSYYRISCPIRRTSFSQKMWPKFDLRLISKLINIRTSIIQHLYREIMKFASKSWALASLWVKSETIVKSLKKCGISSALDGSEDDILYEESDASSENNHKDDFSGNDNNFLGFCDEQIILCLLILVCNNPVFSQ